MIGAERLGADALRVLWHDAECGQYREDLTLWRSLADACGGPVLDVGAGTGRVALDLAVWGHEVTALDHDPALLAALAERAQSRGLDVTTAVADATAFELHQRFALVIMPMQTIQLLDGSAARRSFLRCARTHLQRGGLVAIAVADALAAFDGAADGLPPADVVIAGGVSYRSQTVALVDHGDHAVIHRIRTIGDDRLGEEDRTQLTHLRPERLRADALACGLARRPTRSIAATAEYVGSTVVIAAA